MPTEEEIKQALEDMLYERPQYESDVAVPGGYSDLANVGQKTIQELLRQAEEEGELEPIKPYDAGGERRGITPPENYKEAYKYGKKLDRPESDRDMEMKGERFYSGGERVPLDMFKPPEGRSYLDYDRRGVIFPKLSPGTAMRGGEYNQGRDKVMEFLREQLKNYGY